MAWIELHQSLPTHRKTLAFCDALEIEPVQAVGHLACFWMWAIDNAPGGDLTNISAKTLARAALWPKKNPALFLEALVSAGFVDDAPDGTLTIHDWDSYIGKLISRRDANKERMQRARAEHQPPHSPSTNGTRAQHVRNTNAARAPATVPNPTGPDLTHPEEDSPFDSPSLRRGGKQQQRVTDVDDDFKDDLEDQFWEAFGSRQATRDCIDNALGYRKRGNYRDQRAFLRNWVRSEAEKAAARHSHPTRASPLRALDRHQPDDSPQPALPLCDHCGQLRVAQPGDELCGACQVVKLGIEKGVRPASDFDDRQRRTA